ncbi:CLUMA_CG011293, isoform A [Clunio marinus]|uniref:E3 UFM1-protein ligase 1 homolog n=1 Tax=Clunio marinus TaxID=568069 RepID=A0A1J1IFV6_9DIPT|nr:CLUMA_CG011293, isoform A [Clunio marinus]
MNTDWDEIKRLAADFQKAQLSSTLARLSERNCIEVVSLLLEKGLIDLVFTTDGKEYLTHDHLRREIEDELYVNGGRINLVELSKSLCVDLQKIQPVAEQIAQEDVKITLILGQLISSDYIVRIASEINERLNQNGEVNISELTGAYDLPSDFLLHEIVEKNLGRIIFGKQDSSNPRLLYTSAFISRCKARIRGALAGITKPTPLTAILNQTGIQERIFFSLTNDVSLTGTITSRSTAGSYIPHVYTKTQSEWVKNFFKQNGYLEYESVTALGVGSDPKPFIQKQLSAANKLTFLDKCVVGQRIIDQVESTLEESIATSSFLDVSTILPSVIGEQDIEKLIQIILTPSKQRLTQMFGTLIVTTKYIDNLLKPVYIIAETNAKASVDSGAYQKFIAEKTIKKDFETEEAIGKVDKREERRKKAAGGKAGGGAQGRETKTKSTKKHQRGGKNKDFDDSGSDDDFAAVSKKNKKDQQLDIVHVHEIKKAIKETLENDGLDDIVNEIANFYHVQISKYAQNKAQEFYEASLQNSMQNRKQNHSALQDKLNVLLNDIRLYEKGLKMFTSTETQAQLTKYLLKSLGVDFCNEISFYIAIESELSFPNTLSNQLTTEQRTRIAAECEASFKQPLMAVNKSLNGTVEEFLTAAENILAPCSMILKKIDKKKDKQIILTHKQGLLDQLYKCNDPSLVLHLASLVIFTIATGNMLHASGKFVSSILDFLALGILSDDDNIQLMKFHEFVLMLFRAENDEMKAELNVKLDEMIPKIKDMAANFKKISKNKDDRED